MKAVELQKAEEKKGTAPPDATIREHLGDVYLHLQEVDRARQIWEEAEQIAAKAVPADKRLPEIRKKLTIAQSPGPHSQDVIEPDALSESKKDGHRPPVHCQSQESLEEF